MIITLDHLDHNFLRPGNASMAGKMLKGFVAQRLGVSYFDCPYDGGNGFSMRFRNLWLAGFHLSIRHAEMTEVEAKTFIQSGIGKGRMQ